MCPFDTKDMYVCVCVEGGIMGVEMSSMGPISLILAKPDFSEVDMKPFHY